MNDTQFTVMKIKELGELATEVGRLLNSEYVSLSAIKDESIKAFADLSATKAKIPEVEAVTKTKREEADKIVSLAREEHKRLIDSANDIVAKAYTREQEAERLMQKARDMMFTAEATKKNADTTANKK